MPSLADEITALLGSVISPIRGNFPLTTRFTDKVILGPRTGQQHNAVDWATPVGTPLYAVADGKITRADANDIWGGNIIEERAGSLTTIAAHLSQMLVKPGDTVKRGQLIGYTGNSGQATTGPHLYFETRWNGVPFDPLALFDPLKATAVAAYSGSTEQAALKWITDNIKAATDKNWTWGQFLGSAPAGLFNPDQLKAVLTDNRVADMPVSTPNSAPIVAQILTSNGGVFAPVANAIGGAAAAVLAVPEFLAKVVAQATDPIFWARVLALIAGAILSYSGFQGMWKAAT